jgi:hypothetical protein
MARVKPWTYDSQADHDSEVAYMSKSLEDTIRRKSNVVKGDLTPGKPQNTKEAKI